MNTPLIVLSIATDVDARAWKAKAQQQSPEGVVLHSRESSGTLETIQTLRKDKDGKKTLEDVPITEVELLGLALDASMGLAQEWGEAFVLAADTHQNGMLKVSLHDWVRTGRLNEGDAGFVYAREAWCRVLAALRQEPPRLWIRWQQ